jgi:hypothetical protein
MRVACALGACCCALVYARAFMAGDSTAIEPGKQAAKLHAAPLRVPVCVCVCVCVCVSVCVCVCVCVSCNRHPSPPLSLFPSPPLSPIVVVVDVFFVVLYYYYYYCYLMQAATDVVRVGGQERQATSHVRRLHTGGRQTS